MLSCEHSKRSSVHAQLILVVFFALHCVGELVVVFTALRSDELDLAAKTKTAEGCVLTHHGAFGGIMTGNITGRLSPGQIT